MTKDWFLVDICVDKRLMCWCFVDVWIDKMLMLFLRLINCWYFVNKLLMFCWYFPKVLMFCWYFAGSHFVQEHRKLLKHSPVSVCCPSQHALFYTLWHGTPSHCQHHVPSRNWWWELAWYPGRSGRLCQGSVILPHLIHWTKKEDKCLRNHYHVKFDRMNHL